MTETPEPAPRDRRWFILLAIVTLVGFAIFVGAITICAMRIPQLKKARYGLMENRLGDRPA